MSEIVKSENFSETYSWISEDFVRKLLEKQHLNMCVHEFNYNFEPALSKGENYGSEMVLLDVNYKIVEFPSEQQHISFIIKAELKELEFLSAEYNLFFKEITIFEKILPTVEDLLQEQLSARLYATNFKPTYLVLENLKCRNYKNENRKIGLGYEYLQCVLTKIAKWHAATAVIGSNKEINTAYDTFMKPSVNENSITILTMMKNTILACAELSKNWIGYENISKKLFVLANNCSKLCCTAFKRDDNEFNVLCHGDLWANNIMFKNNADGHPEDAILVDYQICYWGSPALDICNLLYTSSAPDITEKDWDKLIQHYHNILKQTLMKLNYSKEIPSLNEIHVQVLKKGIYASLLTYISIGVRHIDNDEDMDLYKVFITDTDERYWQRVRVFNNDKFKLQIQFYLDFYDRKGYLDI